MNKFFYKEWHPNEKYLIIDLYFNCKCNFDCSYCYLKHYGKIKNELSLEHLKIISDNIKQSKYKKHICFLGGEPTLYKHINDAIEIFSNISDSIEIFTNGSTTKLQKLNFNKKIQITFSIHPEFFSNKIIENILFCKTHNIKFKVKLMMFKKCKEKILQINNILSKNKIEFIPDYIHNKNGEFEIDKLILPNKELQKTYMWMGKSVSIFEIIKNKLNDTHTQKVFCFQNELTVFPNGNIQPFCSDKIDNIFKNKNFFKDYKFNFRQCIFKNLCGCFEQVKYILR